MPTNVQKPGLMPRLTIIIPFRNSAATLPSTIRSLSIASNPIPETDVEILFVDNGSSDQSRIVVDEFCAVQANARCIDEQLAGVSAARNAGLAAARGDYVASVDSDDEIDQKYLSQLLGALKSDPDMVIMPFSSARHGDGWELAKDRNIALDALVGWWCCQFSFRRSLCEGLIFQGQCYEDFGFFPLLMQRSQEIVILHGKLYYYRENSASLTRKSAAWRLAQLEEVWSTLLETNALTEKYILRRVIKDYLQSRMQLRAIAGLWPVLSLRDCASIITLSKGRRLRLVWRILRFHASVLRRKVIAGNRISDA